MVLSWRMSSTNRPLDNDESLAFLFYPSPFIAGRNRSWILLRIPDCSVQPRRHSWKPLLGMVLGSIWKTKVLPHQLGLHRHLCRSLRIGPHVPSRPGGSRNLGIREWQRRCHQNIHQWSLQCQNPAHGILPVHCRLWRFYVCCCCGGRMMGWNSAAGPFLGGVLSKPQENLQWLLRLIPGLASVSHVSPCSILDPLRHPLFLWSNFGVLCVDQYTVLIAWNIEPWNDQRKLRKEESCESMSREQRVNELEILWRSQAQEGGESQL